MSLSAPLLILAIDVATVVCAGLVAVGVLAALPRSRPVWLVALIAVNSACSVILARQDYGFWIPEAFRIDVGPWAPLLNLARNASPGLIMVLCHALFTDRRRFPPLLIVAFAVQLFLEEPIHAVVAASAPLARGLTETAPALLQAMFVAFALFWTVVDWRVDLVDARRRTRAFMLFVTGLSTIADVLLTRVLLDPASPANYQVHVALVAGYGAMMAFVLVQLMRGDLARMLALAPRAERAARPDADADADAALVRLRRLIEVEHICQEPGLTLEALARRVGLPVYRLRRLIHERLGYRNFNALLHDHRIKAACARLSDPDQRRTPILTIALSVGYSSVNTFNRGFREIMDVTPSAYRSLALAEVRPERE